VTSYPASKHNQIITAHVTKQPMLPRCDKTTILLATLCSAPLVSTKLTT